MKRLFVIALALLPSGVFGQAVQDCATGDFDAIPEPWAANTQTFANGQVRLAVLDMIEPALAPAHLLILSPPHDMVGARQCRQIGMGSGYGFYNVDFASLRATYDPATGLSFQINVQISDGDAVVPDFQMMKIDLDQSSGDITAILVAP